MQCHDHLCLSRAQPEHGGNATRERWVHAGFFCLFRACGVANSGVRRVQLGRRARKANLPIIPEADKIEGVFTSWAFPDVYEAGGGHALKGLYVLFHGCHHGAMDW